MKKTKLSVIICTVLLSVCQGCNVAKEVSQAYNIVQCEYDYNSVSNLSFAGIDLSNGIGITDAPKIISLLSGKSSSVPLDFTVNMDVTNPNPSTASLYGLAYILKIDGVEFTTGSINQSLVVPAGDTRILPLAIGVDLVTLLSGDSKNAVENIVKNFIGIGNQKSKVSLLIKPSFLIGNRTLSAPQYIPVSFSFGGK